MFAAQYRRRFFVRSFGIAAAFGLLGAPAATAQYLGGGTKDAVETQIADLEAMRDKFLALAEAFPEDTYDWSPMEGVRSVRDVMALIAAEGVLFPTMWGFDKPDWVADGGFGGELGRLGALSKDELEREIERSFDHVIGLVRGLSKEDRAREVEFFGLTTDLGTAVSLMANDMHEHLGQSIAYARMNEIVPPWSRRE
jgi:hypothetical protein